MNIFSLSHLTYLASKLPDPRSADRPVVRIPIEEWDAIDDADHPAGEFEDHRNPYIEFEIVHWKNIKGVSAHGGSCAGWSRCDPPTTRNHRGCHRTARGAQKRR